MQTSGHRPSFSESRLKCPQTCFSRNSRQRINNDFLSIGAIIPQWEPPLMATRHGIATNANQPPVRTNAVGSPEHERLGVTSLHVKPPADKPPSALPWWVNQAQLQRNHTVGRLHVPPVTRGRTLYHMVLSNTFFAAYTR